MNLTLLIWLNFHIILLLPCVFGSSSGYVRVLLFHDVIFSRSQHSHIVVFSCSVPCFSQLCPIIVRSILELSVESLVTNWGVDHVCVRTECFVRKWFSLEPRCKGMKKNNRLFHFSHGLWPLFPRLVTFLCVSVGYKAKFWSINLDGYCMLLNIRQIGGVLYFYWVWTSGKIMGMMLGAVKKRAESDFSANRPYSLTITVLTVSENYFLHFDRDFYIF